MHPQLPVTFLVAHRIKLSSIQDSPSLLSVAVEAVTVAGTFRDYYKFARLEKAWRSVKENADYCRGSLPRLALPWNTLHLAAVQNSGSWESPPLKKRIDPYKNFLLDTEGLAFLTFHNSRKVLGYCKG